MKKLLLVLIFSGIVGLCEAQTPAVAQAVSEETASAVAPAAAPEAAGEVAPTPAAETPAVPAETPAASAEVQAQEPVEDPAVAKDLAQATDPAAQTGEQLEAVRETIEETPAPKKKKELVVFNSKTHRDPTLSPDDFLLLQYREQQRLAALEAERQRKLAEERRRREEEERRRQLELARIKDPTREVRGLIHIGGIIGQEVFIGDKVYTIGNKVYGARITKVTPDSVVFSYKGHTFVKKMQ